MSAHVHDLLGIGLGPFNLGLACLAEPLRESGELDAVFLEARTEFRWHPGMMLEGATIQVPFLADLVTLADPTSRFTFLNHLKGTGRLYPFYIRESFFPLRSEYDAYCRWAAEQLTSVRWGRGVERVTHAPDPSGATDGHYEVTARLADGTVETHRARHLVLGVGTEPALPAAAADLGGTPAIHSSAFLQHRDRLTSGRSITVVGSGQSAAEIYLDLLESIHDHDYELTWVTRSPRFFPLEYTKLTLEMTSPEYTSYFHALPQPTRDQLLHEQRGLYKGISGDLVDAIYDTLYRKQVTAPVPTRLLTNTALVDASFDPVEEEFTLDLRHVETATSGVLRTEHLVLATGYAAKVPEFLRPVADRIRWDARGRFDVGRDYAVDHGQRDLFVQNAEVHTHGIVAPDLGMGAMRNSTILARVLGREVYPVERRIAFQEFGMPADLRVSDTDAARRPLATTGASR